MAQNSAHITLRNPFAMLPAAWAWEGPRLRLLGAVLLAAFCALSLYLQLSYVLGSAPLYHVSVGVQDDSYYYLQPAWLFPHKHFFTFDGIHPTYGFEPLWMLVLTAMRPLYGDKLSFLVGSLAVSAVLFNASGALTYFLCRKWMPPLPALLLPCAWLFNPNLFLTYVSGKENGLAMFVLAITLLIAYWALGKSGRWPYLSLGACLGLLVLARFNFLLLALLLVLTLLVLARRPRKIRLVQAGWLALGLLVVAGPWFAYADAAYGAIMPTSGARKLIGAEAKAVNSISAVTHIPRAVFRPLLSSRENDMLVQNETIGRGDFRRLEGYWFSNLPNLAIRPLNLGRFWPFLALAVSAALFCFDAVRKRKSSLNRSALRQFLGRHAPILMLVFFALINSGLNALFLGSFLEYATWYSVAEVLVLLLFCSAMFSPLARQPAFGLALVVLYVFWLRSPMRTAKRILEPKPFRAAAMKTSFTYQAYLAADWMNGRLPAGSRVGSFSSGTIGYFYTAGSVINLDGLANSPRFLNDVYWGHLNHPNGDDPMLEYLRREGIGWIADAEFQDDLGKKPLLGFLPNYQVLYRGGLVNFGEGRLRRLFVARIRMQVGTP